MVDTFPTVAQGFNLLISDDEYYSCGFLTTNNKFQILSFYLI
jgi:hypothetical protein